MTEDLDRLQRENIDLYMKKGPGLRVGYNKWVVARDRAKNAVLLGGLGAMGVGEMWTAEQEYHRGYAGYEDAPDGTAVDLDGSPFRG